MAVQASLGGSGVVAAHTAVSAVMKDAIGAAEGEVHGAGHRDLADAVAVGVEDLHAGRPGASRRSPAASTLMPSG